MQLESHEGIFRKQVNVYVFEIYVRLNQLFFWLKNNYSSSLNLVELINSYQQFFCNPRLCCCFLSHI